MQFDNSSVSIVKEKMMHIKLWFGFWLDNKSSFSSFYVLIYCLKERVSIVRKTKVFLTKKTYASHYHISLTSISRETCVSYNAFCGISFRGGTITL